MTPPCKANLHPAIAVAATYYSPATLRYALAPNVRPSSQHGRYECLDGFAAHHGGVGVDGCSRRGGLECQGRCGREEKGRSTTSMIFSHCFLFVPDSKTVT
jgi:hypothetical protein